MEGWIYEENLKPFVLALAWTRNAQCDPDDWLAISHGIKATDAEKGNWFSYSLASKTGKTDFSIARDIGSSVILVRIENQGLHGDLGLLFLICQSFTLRER